MHAVALIGAGLMGTGLARLFTRIGWPVAVWDRDPAALAALVAAIPAVRAGTSLADAVAGAVLVIEAVAEIASVKQAVFAELAAACAPDTILATNSSVIAVGIVTAELSDADAARALGTHFWNPPDIVPLVEVIAGPRTTLAAIDAVMGLLRDAAREPVHVRRDVVPGNRMQHALWREAMALVDEGVCTPEDVDTIVLRSFGARLAVLGPLANADLVGLELTRQIHDVVLPQLSRATEPAPGLTARLAAGATGIAAGAGFHADWTTARIAALRERIASHLRAAFAPC